MTKISGEQDLENTYKLASAADIVDYYRGFAPTYDAGFVQEMGYHYPKGKPRPTTPPLPTSVAAQVS